MIDLKQFERKQIKDLLALFDYIFTHHASTEEVRETLNLLNLSMRRIIDILESSVTIQEIDQQIQELGEQLRGYVENFVSHAENRIPQFVQDFLEMVDTYYKFVDKDKEAVLDLCNVFRIVTEVYLRTDRADEERKAFIREGINELVDDWLSGEVKPPSSRDEIEPTEVHEDPLIPTLTYHYQTVLVEKHEGVVHVSLQRPDKSNALNGTMVNELNQVFTLAGQDSQTRVIILTGSGDSFCAGADLQEMAGELRQSPEEFAQALGQTLRTIQQCPKPVIARVNGPVIGGGMGLICAADLVLAAESAIFSMPEVQLGLVPAMIGAFVLDRLGITLTRRLMLTGERFGAMQAQEWGVVNEVVAVTELDLLCSKYIQHLKRGAPQALADCKALLRYLQGHTLDENLVYASQLFGNRLRHPECQEGLQAKAQKRKPSWLAK